MILAIPGIVAELIVGEAAFVALGYELLFAVTGVVTFLGWILLGDRMRTPASVKNTT